MLPVTEAFRRRQLRLLAWHSSRSSSSDTRQPGADGPYAYSGGTADRSTGYGPGEGSGYAPCRSRHGAESERLMRQLLLTWAVVWAAALAMASAPVAAAADAVVPPPGPSPAAEFRLFIKSIGRGLLAPDPPGAPAARAAQA